MARVFARRIVPKVSALALTAASFVVAAVTGGVPAAVVPAAHAAEKVTVTFWHVMDVVGDRQAFDEMVKEFNASQERIQVKVVLVPGGATEKSKLLAAVAGGSGPDIYLLDRFTVAETAHAGILQPLDQFVDGDRLNLDEYLPFALREATWEGKLYGLPLDADARVLYSRTDLFDEAGLDSRRPPATIDDLEAAVRRLTTAKDDRYQRLGLIPWQSQGNLYTWGFSFGGSFYDPVRRKITADHPQVVAALSWMQDYVNRYDWGKIQHLIGQFGRDVREPFLAGQVAMVVDGNWRLNTIRRFAPKLDFSLAPIPYPKQGGKMTTWSGGWAFVIPSGAKHPAEAWEFMKFAAGRRGQELFMTLGDHLPTLNSLLKSDYLTRDPYQRAFAGLLPYAQSRPPLPVGGLYWDALQKAMNDVLPGKKTAAAALAEVTEAVQRELDRVLKR